MSKIQRVWEIEVGSKYNETCYNRYKIVSETMEEACDRVKKIIKKEGFDSVNELIITGASCLGIIS